MGYTWFSSMCSCALASVEHVNRPDLARSSLRHVVTLQVRWHMSAAHPQPKSCMCQAEKAAMERRFLVKASAGVTTPEPMAADIGNVRDSTEFHGIG